MRSVNKRVTARHKGAEGEERRKKHYCVLLRLTRQILNDPQRVMAEVEDLGRNKKRKLQPLTPLQRSEGGKTPFNHHSRPTKKALRQLENAILRRKVARGLEVKNLL
jgi:hypothetical protein